jgi:hypothetical protein
LIGFAVATLLAAAVHSPKFSPGGLPGTNGIVEGLGAALLVITVLFGLLLLPAALLARRAWKTMPRRLRPWAGGWAAAPALILAGLLGGGFGAGMTIAVRRLLSDNLRLPDTYQLITVLWGAGLALAAVLALPGARKGRGRRLGEVRLGTTTSAPPGAGRGVRDVGRCGAAARRPLRAEQGAGVVRPALGHRRGGTGPARRRSAPRGLRRGQDTPA